MRLGLHPLLVLLLATPAAAQTATPPVTRPDLGSVAALADKGQLEAAERQLRQLLAQGGGAPVRDLLGVVLSRQGKLDEAEAQLQKALAADPALPGLRQHLARVYLAQGRDAEAAAELRQAARQRPLERDLALKLADIELSEGHPALAERQLRAAADHFQSVAALLQLARLQSRQGDAAGALESLERARPLAPNSEDVLSAYGQLSLAGREPLGAIGALEPLTRMCPTVATYHYLLGAALMQLEDTPAAIEVLRRAEQLEPERTPTLVALGLALNGRKLYGEAKPYLLRCLELEPDNVDAMAALAESEEGLGELAQAETHAQRALARAGANPTANLVIGMLRMKQGRYAEARDALEKAVAAEPTSPKVHYQLSLAHARLNEDASANKHLELYRQLLKEAEERRHRAGRQEDTSSGDSPP